jgi:hypothetical protein
MIKATVLDILDAIDQYDREQELAEQEPIEKSQAHDRLEQFYDFIDSQQNKVSQ